MVRKSQFQGLVSLALAALFYGLYGVFSRVISMDFGAVFQAVAKNLIVFLMLAAYILYSKSWKKIASSDFKWFLLMNLPGIMAIVTIFIAFNNLALGTAMFTVYATSTLTGYFLGFVLFGERLTAQKVVSLLACFTGLYLMFSNSFSGGRFLFLILACLSGVGSAAWNVFSKKVSSKYSLAEILVVDSSLTMMVGFPLAVLLREPTAFPSFSQQWLGVLLYALVSFLACLLTLNGFRHLQAQIGSLILLLEPVFATFFGWLFYREILTAYAVLGGLLILFGAALSNLKIDSRKAANS